MGRFDGMLPFIALDSDCVRVEAVAAPFGINLPPRVQISVGQTFGHAQLVLELNAEQAKNLHWLLELLGVHNTEPRS